MTEPATVGVIGLGRMGGPIADRLVAAGHDVAVFDIADDALAPRLAAGARAARSPADAARGAAVVIIVVFDDAQVDAVLTGPDGVLSAVAPGAVISVHTTVSIETIHSLAAAADAHGAVLVDAGISGGEPGAVEGTLLTMVGGPTEALEAARTVFLAYSKEVLHAGPLGTGMALKLARNATGYVMMAAVHEAMALAEGSGIDLALLRHAIAETGVLDQALAPFALGGPGPLPDTLDDPFRAAMVHTTRLAEKDLDQAMALAGRTGTAVPVIEVVRRSFHHVMRI